ncbi:MAG: TfoX/Sxy family protein [Acidimicrobiales bacterium]|nr:TfoX/Sxy family protein [Acidimicrobiales bacterium]
MGDAGARYSDEVGVFADELLDTFAPLGEVTWKKMFGGAGVFVDGSMFGLIDTEAKLHLKADDSNREQFETAGGVKHGRMPYYSVPSEVLEDDDKLLSWAKTSAEIATG